MSQNPNTPDSSESTPAGDTPRVPLRRTLFGFSSKDFLDASLYKVAAVSDSDFGYPESFPITMDIAPVDRPSYPEGRYGWEVEAKILADQGYEMKRLSWGYEDLDVIYGPKVGYGLQRIDGRDFGLMDAAIAVASVGITLTCPDAPKAPA